MRTIKTYFDNREKMIKVLVVSLMGLVVATFGALQAVPTNAQESGYGYGSPTQASPSSVYRSYKQGVVDHFYTISATENASAISNFGYTGEGVAFKGYTGEGPNVGNTSPVYRTLNKVKGDHFYTTSFSEYANSQNFGYTLEGVGFRNYNSREDAPGSGGTSGTFVNPVYRLYNNAAGDHLYTVSAAERDAAAAAGWASEGTAFWAPQ